jgi:hypothetical protein
VKIITLFVIVIIFENARLSFDPRASEMSFIALFEIPRPHPVLVN